MPAPGPVTAILDQIRSGRTQAADDLYRLVHEELARMAHAKIARENRRPGAVLETQALVNEAYLRLVGDEGKFENRRHFFGAAARAMRQVLIDQSRKMSDSHGEPRMVRGGFDLEEPAAGTTPTASTSNVMQLDGLLRELELVDERAAEVVNLRYFAGMTMEQAAEVLAITPKTVQRDWRFARAWMRSRAGLKN